MSFPITVKKGWHLSSMVAEPPATLESNLNIWKSQSHMCLRSFHCIFRMSSVRQSHWCCLKSTATQLFVKKNLFRPTAKRWSKLHPNVGNSLRTGGFLHKESVVRKVFPCLDIIMFPVCHDVAIMWTLLLTHAKLSLSAGMEQGAALNLMLKSFPKWFKWIRGLKACIFFITYLDSEEISLLISPVTAKTT